MVLISTRLTKVMTLRSTTDPVPVLPDSAVSKNGLVLTAWQRGDGATGGLGAIEISATDTGGNVAFRFLINRGDSNFPHNPAVVALEDGTWVVTWNEMREQPDGSAKSYIRYQLIDESGRKKGGGDVLSSVEGTNGWVLDAKSLKGDAWITAVLADDHETNRDIVLISHYFGGKIVTTKVFTPRESVIDNFSIQPLKDGGWALAYSTTSSLSDSTPGTVHVKTFSKYGKATGYDTIDLRPAAPSLSTAALDSGGTVVSWVEGGGETSIVYMARFDAHGSRVGAVDRVSFKDTVTDSPSITALKDGGWIIAWADLNATYFQAYNRDGLKRGSITQVGDGQGLGQMQAVVTELSTGGWVVSWLKEITVQGFYSWALQTQVFNADGTPAGDQNTATNVVFGPGHYNTEYTIVATKDAGYVLTWSMGATLKQAIYHVDQSITGNSSVNRLQGGGGTDHLQGKSGADTLYGGIGDDLLVGGGDADKLHGDDGLDTAGYLDAKAAVRVSLQNPNSNTGDAKGDTFYSIENLIGSAFSDRLEGDGRGNRLSGGVGDDLLFGLAGVDVLTGGVGNDMLIGGAGADRLYGSSGRDVASYVDAKAGVTASLANPSGNTGDAKGDVYSSIEDINGSAYADKLAGNDAANRLSGGAGNDGITGARGADQLYGGAGADMFIYTSYRDSTMSARDMIYDFSQAQGDRIHLSNIDARISTAADDAFVFIGEKAFSAKAGELRYLHQGGDTFIYGDVNGDGRADFSLRLDKTIELVKGDFIL